MPSMKFNVEHAKSGRSRCKKCKQVISKDEVRVGKVVEINGNESCQWFHPGCITTRDAIDFENVKGLDSLNVSDRKEVEEHLRHTHEKKARKSPSKKKVKEETSSPAKKSKQVKKVKKEEKEDNEGEQSARRGSKRKAKRAVKYTESDVEGSVHDSDVTEMLVDESDSDVSVDKDALEIEPEDTKPAKKKVKKTVVKPTGRNKRKSEMTITKNTDVKGSASKSDSKEAILRNEKYGKMVISELKEHLKRNKQLLAGKKDELVARCVDGELRGALEHCKICGNGRLHLDESGDSRVFKCKGYFDDELNTFVSCSFVGDESQVSRRKWLFPGEESNQDDEKQGSSGASNLDSDEVLKDVEATCPNNISLKEAVSKFVKLARKYKLSVSNEDSAAGQQCIGVIMAAKSGSGIDSHAAWKQLVSKFPTKEQVEKAKPTRKALVDDNTELAAMFDEIASLEAKLQNENASFKVAANKKAANAIRALTFKVTDGKVLATGSKKKGVEKVKGIGKRTGSLIDEFLETGKCTLLEQLREDALNAT